mmetsp:Transcript_6179/g.16175  ORF Transcript_6179/g.16175 Transcript_6179/m.16175 type:complete len:248 (-) Transcript_6179:267-1010(-)
MESAARCALQPCDPLGCRLWWVEAITLLLVRLSLCGALVPFALDGAVRVVENCEEDVDENEEDEDCIAEKEGDGEPLLLRRANHLPVDVDDAKDLVEQRREREDRRREEDERGSKHLFGEHGEAEEEEEEHGEEIGHVRKGRLEHIPQQRGRIEEAEVLKELEERDDDRDGVEREGQRVGVGDGAELGVARGEHSERVRVTHRVGGEGDTRRPRDDERRDVGDLEHVPDVGEVRHRRAIVPPDVDVA